MTCLSDTKWRHPECEATVLFRCFGCFGSGAPAPQDLSIAPATLIITNTISYMVSVTSRNSGNRVASTLPNKRNIETWETQPKGQRTQAYGKRDAPQASGPILPHAAATRSHPEMRRRGRSERALCLHHHRSAARSSHAKNHEDAYRCAISSFSQLQLVSNERATRPSGMQRDSVAGRPIPPTTSLERVT